MTVRIDYAKAAPDVYKALISTHTALKKSGFDTHLMDLVFQRVSQINGCAYCVDAHGRDLRAAGETPERLDGLAAGTSRRISPSARRRRSPGPSRSPKSRPRARPITSMPRCAGISPSATRPISRLRSR